MFPFLCNGAALPTVQRDRVGPASQLAQEGRRQLVVITPHPRSAPSLKENERKVLISFICSSNPHDPQQVNFYQPCFAVNASVISYRNTALNIFFHKGLCIWDHIHVKRLNVPGARTQLEEPVEEELLGFWAQCSHLLISLNRKQKREWRKMLSYLYSWTWLWSVMPYRMSYNTTG